MNIEIIQKEIQKDPTLDGWLLYDFRGNNTLIKNFLKLRAGTFLSRRFFYFIPKIGIPCKIVHYIEKEVVDHLPGTLFVYSSWQELERVLQTQLHGKRKIAMEYSPYNAIPTISKLDAGEADCIRKMGIEIVSSWPLLAPFVAKISKEARAQQKQAAEFLLQTMNNAFQKIAQSIQSGKSISEYDVQQYILEKLENNNCITDHPPICAVNQNTALPHYCPDAKAPKKIHKGDYVLIDAWCKLNQEGAPFADFTQVMSFAEKPPKELERIYSIVYAAQERGVQFLQQKLSKKEPVQGFEVDDAVRKVIQEHKLEKFFSHRTGHSIDTELHGSGANFDNLETHDTRLLLPNTAYSIEPGIYLPDAFGVRLEMNVFISEEVDLDLLGKAKPSLPSS